MAVVLKDSLKLELGHSRKIEMFLLGKQIGVGLGKFRCYLNCELYSEEKLTPVTTCKRTAS